MGRVAARLPRAPLPMVPLAPPRPAAARAAGARVGGRAAGGRPAAVPRGVSFPQLSATACWWGRRPPASTPSPRRRAGTGPDPKLVRFSIDSPNVATWPVWSQGHPKHTAILACHDPPPRDGVRVFSLTRGFSGGESKLASMLVFWSPRGARVPMAWGGCVGAAGYPMGCQIGRLMWHETPLARPSQATKISKPNRFAYPFRSRPRG